MSKHNIIESEGVNNHGVEAPVFTCTRCGMEDNHRHRIEWEPCVAAAEGVDQVLDQDLQEIQQLIDEAKVRRPMETIERYRSALERIANPIAAMKADAEREGMRLDGAMAVSQANNPEYLRSIARGALEAGEVGGNDLG